MHDETMTERATIDRAHLAQLHGRRLAFRAARPRSAAHCRARPSAPAWRGADELDGEVAGEFPVFVERAEGAHFTCVDGIDHIDLCLGDTGAMMGHSQPQPWTP